MHMKKMKEIMKRKTVRKGVGRMLFVPVMILISFAGKGPVYAKEAEFFSVSNTAESGWVREGDSYCYLDKNGNPKTGWLQDKGKWYYLDPKTGFMKTGWLQDKGKWYYFGIKTGAMQTGWLQQNGKWYYFSPKTGAMRTGWLQQNGKWYFFNPKTGAMRTGWLQQSGKWYYFSPKTGAMRTGWLNDKGHWYFFETDSGAMKTGWLALGSSKYLFHDGGDMAVGWEKVGEDTFFFTESGAAAFGWQTLDKKTYYFKDSGAMAVGEILVIGGKRQGFSGAGEWLGEKSDAFLNAYGKALTFVEENTDASMSKAEKLRKCFNQIRDTFHEKNPWIPHYTGMDWAEKYAYAGFDTKSGNCFTFGACMAFSARAIGYDNVYACSSGGHGWAEIGGEVYDPEWTKHAEGNYFGRPLVKGDSPNYMGAVTRTGSSWTYRKI